LISESHQKTPNRFVLYQNYPNPFNACTKIEFSLKRSAFITLNVYNISGQKIKVLSEGVLCPGYYAIEWVTKDLPSGVYLCRLEAGEYVETKKLTLQR
jgi:hypothetical protein